MFSKLVLLIFGLWICASCHALEIYRFVDKSGTVSFTDRNTHDSYIPMKNTWKGWVDLRVTTSLRDGQRKYKPIVLSTARRLEISPELISAVIHAESHYNPVAISSKGAVGLMQLMPGTARRYGVHNRQDPKENIRGGSEYLSDLLSMFDNNTELALAAYNAGENAVIKRGNQIPPYPETKNYVKKVIQLLKDYKQQRLY